MLREQRRSILILILTVLIVTFVVCTAITVYPMVSRTQSKLQLHLSSIQF